MELITKKNKKLNQLGRIKFLDSKTNFFIKIYKKGILKDDYSKILKRVSIINSFVDYNLSIPFLNL